MVAPEVVDLLAADPQELAWAKAVAVVRAAVAPQALVALVAELLELELGKAAGDPEVLAALEDLVQEGPAVEVLADQEAKAVPVDSVLEAQVAEDPAARVDLVDLADPAARAAWEQQAHPKSSKTFDLS